MGFIKAQLIVMVVITVLAASYMVQAGEIHDAVQARNTASVKQLLAANPDLVNARAEDDLTPLHIAVRLNDEALAKLLLVNGADVNAKTKQGSTPLALAVKEKARTIVKLLITQTSCAYTDHFLDVRYTEGQKAREAGELNSAYEIFTDLLKEDPGNEKINFAYGLTCFSLKDYSRARLALERVLQINPDNERANLELAHSNLALNQLDLAREQFESVLSRNPPESVRRNIECYLKQIKERVRKWYFSTRIDAGTFDDDNVNVGPDSDVISIEPIIFGISTMTVDRPVQAEGVFSSVALSGTYEIGERGKWGMTTDGVYYQNWLDDEPDHEILFYQLAAGLKHVGTRTVVQLPIKAAHITSGHDSLVNLYGISPLHLYVYGDAGDWHFHTSGTAEFRDYDEMDDRDGIYVSLSETLYHYFGKRGHNISMGITISHDHTDAAIYEYTGRAWNLSGGVNLPWDATLYASVGYTVNDYAEREILAPEERTDNQHRFITGIKKMFTRQWGMDINHQITDNNSTYGLYQYDRNVTTISTFCTF